MLHLTLTASELWAGQTQGGEASRRDMSRIPLALPIWTDEMEKAALRVFASKRWVKGPESKAFGEEFAQWCGAKTAVPCQSGSAALWAAMRLLEIGPGDEVIVPSLTFIATATSVSLTGATPIFADVENEYWCICPDDVEKKITERTKAVIGVHLFGQPFSSRLRDICDSNNIALIEDAAQAHGATLDGKMVGSIGDVACFSFFPSKNMAVGGEGGMVTTIREELSTRLRRIIDHGRSDMLEAVELGTNLRMSEVMAAIGRVQLKHVDDWTKKRREHSVKINHSTKIRDGAEHAWHQLCILSEDPSELIKMLNEAEIDARIHYPIPCHRQAVFTDHPQHESKLPVCENISHRLVAIPVHPGLSEEDLIRINSVLNP